MKRIELKKAQSALEFLVTYGWAFLVVLAMIGGLSYFGVLNPGRYLPDKCLFSIGIGACVDFGAVANAIQFSVVNNFGKDATINGGNVTITGLATTCAPSTNAIPITIGSNYNASINQSGTWPVGAVANVSIPCTIATGERATAKFTLQVTTLNSNFPKFVTGEFVVRRN